MFKIYQHKCKLLSIGKIREIIGVNTAARAASSLLIAAPLLEGHLRMFNKHSFPTPPTIVYNWPVKPFALKIVLDSTTSLYWRIDANANDAQAKEKEHRHPFQNGSAGAFTQDFGHTGILAMRARNLLRLFSSSFFCDLLKGYRFILYIRKIYLLNWSILSMRYLFIINSGWTCFRIIQRRWTIVYYVFLIISVATVD